LCWNTQPNTPPPPSVHIYQHHRSISTTPKQHAFHQTRLSPIPKSFCFAMSTNTSLARSRGMIKSRKTQEYIDMLAARINERGDGLQDADIYAVKEYLNAYDYRTIKVSIIRSLSHRSILIHSFADLAGTPCRCDLAT
jgi:hypothetical protein